MGDQRKSSKGVNEMVGFYFEEIGYKVIVVASENKGEAVFNEVKDGSKGYYWQRMEVCRMARIFRSALVEKGISTYNERRILDWLDIHDKK